MAGCPLARGGRPKEQGPHKGYLKTDQQIPPLTCLLICLTCRKTSSPGPEQVRLCALRVLIMQEPPSSWFPVVLSHVVCFIIPASTPEFSHW